MNELLEKVRTMLKADPYRAYVPIVEMSREEQILLSDARVDIYKREEGLCYNVCNMHMCVRSFLTMREMLDSLREESSSREKQQLESFALEG